MSAQIVSLEQDKPFCSIEVLYLREVKNKSCILLSTAEAEYVAMSVFFQELKRIRLFLAEIEISQK